MGVRADYLEANEAFYSSFWRSTPNYGAPFPNAEEAARAGVILHLLAAVAERDGWSARRPRILDAGCGRGWLTNLVAVFGEAEGCEPVADAVALARSLYPALRFHPVTPGELADSSDFQPFDVVVCSEVIEHVPAELQNRFVADLYRCTRPGGTLVLTTPRGELQAAAGESSQQSIEVWRTEAEIESLLTGAGFVPLACKRVFPIGGRIADGIARRLPDRVAARLRRSWIGAALDHSSSLYQVWCCSRG